jgi:DedD protein
MADRIVENADRIVDEMRRKARRRLVGAIVLALAAAIILPMLLEKEPRPLGDDVTVKIPPVDEGKFINKLTGKSGDGKPLPKADEKSDSKAAPAKSETRSETAAPSFASAPVASPLPESAAAKRSAVETPERAMTPPANSSTKGDAESTPAAPVEAKSDAKPAAMDASTSPAEEKTATASAPAAQSAPVAASSPRGDGFVVQLAAFADDKGANSLANKLKKAGYAAFIEPVHTSRGTLWRVRVGGYGSKPEADAARVKLKGEGYSGIVAPAS